MWTSHRCCPRRDAAVAFRTVALSLTILFGGLWVLFLATDHFRAFTTEAARRVAVRERPVPVPSVELEDQSGASTSLAHYRGGWLLVDFVYTRCTTLCSLLGNDFAQLQRKLADPIAAGRVRLLSISFDPEHDSPRELASYVARSGGRGSSWTAARPVTTDGLRGLADVFGVIVIPDGTGGFTHNAAIHIVNPEGRLVRIMGMGAPDSVAATMLALLGP